MAMLHSVRIVAVLAVCAACATPAAALYMERRSEEFGPAPPGLEKPTDKRYALAYAPGRCYLRHTSRSGWGAHHEEELAAFAGNAERVNAALAEFAALPIADKEIRLFPGPGTVRSLNGGVTLSCDWHIEWSSHLLLPRGERKGTSETHRAVLTIFVSRVDQAPPADPRNAEWIKELDDARFAVRERAFRALAAQGDAAAPALRQALGERPTLEQKERIDRLLRRLDAIHLGQLKLPKDIPIKSLDQLMERERRHWGSGDLGKSWDAANHVAAWAEYSEQTCPLLVEMFGDSREQVRDLALNAIVRLGKRAQPALSALRAAEANLPAANVPAVRRALQALAEAPPLGDVEERWQRNRLLRDAISQFCESNH